ncbi:hypothetical protein [Mesorhizobium sp. B1-1-7]|uniref:hypothetical protein n=1 Tax=Mesorhizobium sp. B1-1-7 TaxID=2589977 RepID=UPI00112EC2ED|nr:hypothetical protein [Mesorhizobium sp. B1-1-7]TPN57180.1 hypothetical protein FJ978_00730 [Mesorhizobium sp. B1-1-7]
MSNVIPMPLQNIDMQISEAAALAETLIALGENMEDAEYLRMRASSMALLYILTDRLKSADRSIPGLYRRG